MPRVSSSRHTRRKQHTNRNTMVRTHPPALPLIQHHPPIRTKTLAPYSLANSNPPSNNIANPLFTTYTSPNRDKPHPRIHPTRIFNTKRECEVKVAFWIPFGGGIKRREGLWKKGEYTVSFDAWRGTFEVGFTFPASGGGSTFPCTDADSTVDIGRTSTPYSPT
ncbi:hypothetical protein BDQ17DRAFT_197693 [Cyathus striatus]|nr:hypothetical protein BDQ17DRAFT_197693 [Cyathus striatus]